jgi:hypothetical protein
VTVNGGRVRDRLLNLTLPPTASLLAEQLRDGMMDLEYAAVAIAIVRALTTRAKEPQ